jgi:hypothetical protein
MRGKLKWTGEGRHRIQAAQATARAKTAAWRKPMGQSVGTQTVRMPKKSRTVRKTAENLTHPVPTTVRLMP